MSYIAYMFCLLVSWALQDDADLLRSGSEEFLGGQCGHHKFRVVSELQNSSPSDLLCYLGSVGILVSCR